jgi:hypothetical protein
MPKAKNTSHAAYVCRFNGGQFAIDGDEGINVKNWGPERTNSYKATNMEFKGVAKAGKGQFSASVKTAANVSSEAKGSKVREFTNAHVGGGHPRKHQG